MATVVVLRLRPGTGRGRSPAGWAALATAVTTCAAITGTQVSAGYLQLFDAVDGKTVSALPPAEREVMFQGVVYPSMVRGVLLQWAVLLTLFGITGLSGRRCLTWPGRVAHRPLLVFLIALGITSGSTPILLGAMSSAGDQWRR